MKIEEMIAKNRADCSGCAACANICPLNAIEMTRDAEGFSYPKINPDRCVKCRRCDMTCPALNFKKNELKAFPATFAATYPDDKILRHSSSGGVFTALSEIVLRGGGVVFGAAFDKNWHVFHTAARTLDELENLRGSKYVQSQIGEVYRQVRDALKSTSVLFSGTPCQCAGLKNFLGSDPENLLTVDIICHGTPSPAVWESYIDEIGNRNEIAHVNFRSKRGGWGSRIEINFFNRSFYTQSTGKNLHGKLFLKSVTERPSCQSCKSKFPNGKSDLTIGDAWGIKKFAPEMFDERGVSVVFVHTAKGKNFFEQTPLKKQPVKFANAARNNPTFIIPVAADRRRKKFFAEFAESDDKFGILEKYYHQDDEEISKKFPKPKGFSFKKSYADIAAQIRKNFKRNILIVAPNLEDNVKKSLFDYFDWKLPEINVHILQRGDAENFICTESFSLLTFDVKENAAALKEFAEQFNVTEILIDKELKSDSPALIDWLKNCSLPVKKFSIVRNK